MKNGWIILFLSIPSFLHSQHNQIDSLKRALRSAKDSSRVDCLNRLSAEYHKNALPATYHNVQTDTANLLASEAYSEATLICYNNGMAEALQNLGEIARDRGDYRTAENYFHQAIPIFEMLHASERLSWSNLTLGWCQFKQCKFSKAKLAYERAMPYCMDVNNKVRQTMLLRMISYIYSARGFNEKAFENMLQAIRITNIVGDSRGVTSSPQSMGLLYENAGEMETALTYYRLAAAKAKENFRPIVYNKIMGLIYSLLNRMDSAVNYYRESYECVKAATPDPGARKKELTEINVYIGEVYLKENKFDLAIELFKDAFSFYNKANDKICMMRIRRNLAMCYQAKNDMALSIIYARHLLKMSQATGARPHTRDAFELLWKSYDHEKKTDSAYKYHLKYIVIKDSITRDEYRRNLALSEMKSHDDQQKIKISLLQKDQQIIREQLSIQRQKLRSELLVRNIFIVSACAFTLIVLFIFRSIVLSRRNEKQRLEHKLELQQLETQKEKFEFQNRATDLEMQALRAQMNPHFIFNCLSSINRFILINRTEEASDYLTKFSRLIRMALHNSKKSFLALGDELEALRLYLDLERLRFKNSFNYSITFFNTIDVTSVFIPPMLLQPFVENAIWHGLMHRQEGTGHLDIMLSIEEGILTCVITDDGIGRHNAALIKSKSVENNKSMGVQITIDRLALLSRNENERVSFNIEDLTDHDGNASGTKVILKLKYRDLADAYEYQNL